ncbi:hypothetical protein [Aliivibrio kagoshimensis]|uniref:hypothetical protein n=1 Tax=Aliivibrio kagoshimensis TaxID=2910230 RepID=UPI003D0BD73C
MTVDRALLIARIMLAGQTRLIRLTTYSIPLVFLFVFYAYLGASSVLNRFEHYMEQSFVGIMGQVQVSSPSRDFLTALQQVPVLSGVSNSLRLESKSLLHIGTEQLDLVKGITLLTYEDDYLQNKFSDLDSQQVIMSRVLANQLGITEMNTELTLMVPSVKVKKTFSTIYLVDFGFLTSDPIVIISQQQYQTLFGVPPKFNQLEFSGLSTSAVDKLRRTIDDHFTNSQSLSYKVVDVKALTSEHSQIFSNLQHFKIVLFGFLLGLCCAVFYVAVRMLMVAKQNALEVMQLLGMTYSELWAYIVILSSLFTLLLYFAAHLSWTLSEQLIFAYLSLI